MKALLFLFGIILCSSLPSVSSSVIQNDLGSHDFLDEFGLPNDGFGWDTEAFFPDNDDTTVDDAEVPEEHPEEPPVEEDHTSLPDDGESGNEEAPFPGEEECIIPDEEEYVIPDEEEYVIPDEEEYVIPDEEEYVIPDEEEYVIPDEEDPIEEEPEEPEEDPLRDSLVEFGVELIIEQARLDHNISKANYTTKLISSSDVSDSYGVLYRLSCNITHQNRSLVIMARFNVYYQFSSGRRTLSSFSYTLNTDPQPTEPTEPTDPTDPTDPTGPTIPDPTDDYVELTPAQIYSDAEAQHILDFATSWIIEKGYEAGKIPVSDYQVIDIVSFERKVQSNGINFYKGNIKLEDEKKVLVNVQYTISIRSSTLAKFVYYWYYNVSNIRFLVVSDEPIDGDYFDEERSLVGEYVD